MKTRPFKEMAKNAEGDHHDITLAGEMFMTHKSRSTVTVTVGHIDYVAEYEIDNETLRVTAAHGAKSTPLGGTAPEEQARLILGEMIKEGTASDCV